MADYYSLPESKIKEALDDPAKVRQVVYEAARLALKRQVLLQQPPITIREGKRLLDDLEDAITRCEADWAGAVEGNRPTSRPMRLRKSDRPRCGPRTTGALARNIGQPAQEAPATMARADPRFDEGAGRRMDRYERAGNRVENDGPEPLEEPDLESPKRPRNSLGTRQVTALNTAILLRPAPTAGPASRRRRDLFKFDQLIVADCIDGV
jgi:hypothetical protein